MLRMRYKAKSTLEISCTVPGKFTRSAPEAAKRVHHFFITMGISTDYRPPSLSLPIFSKISKVVREHRKLLELRTPDSRFAPLSPPSRLSTFLLDVSSNDICLDQSIFICEIGSNQRLFLEGTAEPYTEPYLLSKSRDPAIGINQLDSRLFDIL